MALPVFWFGTALDDVASGDLDLEAVTLTATLHGIAFTPTSAMVATSELTDEVVGTGYAPEDLTTVEVIITDQDGAPTLVKVSADPTVWTGLAPEARWIVVSTGTRLLWWVDPGQVLQADGNDATVRWRIQTATPTPWATSALVNTMVFHSSQSRADHETYEGLMGRDVLFALRFLTGGWAGSGRPTSWASTKSAYQNVLNPAGDWIANRPEVTQFVSCPILYGGQNLDQALASTTASAGAGSGETFWRDFGGFCWTNGLCELQADGRPKVWLRVGWEMDGEWYPWGLRFNRGALSNAAAIALNAPKFKALFDQSHAWFDAGVVAAGGTQADADNVWWDQNMMAAGWNATDLATALADTAKSYSDDSYDDMAGGAFYGTDANVLSQATKDAHFLAVRNAIVNSSTGRAWLVAQCVARAKIYGLAEAGPYFDEPAGQRREAGGDHAYPDISWFKAELDWFNSPTGPQALGILGFWCIYNAVVSGNQGTTKFVPEQSYAPETYDAWLAALHP